MTKRLSFVFTFVIVILYCGCSAKDVKEGTELFYNPYIQKFVCYNHRYQSNNLLDPTKNQFQYSVDNEDIYVDGNSFTNEFEIVRLNDNSLSKIYAFSKNEGFFPIGKMDGKLYFIHSYYDKNGQEEREKRRLAVFDLNTEKVEDFTNVFGLIDYGAVGKDYIYYTVYNEQKDIYTLMRVKNDDTNQTPEIIKTTVQDGLVLVGGNELYYSDGNRLISEKKEYKKESINFFHHNSLIQCYINSKSQLCIRITNIRNNIVLVEENIIGIKIKNNEIIVCKLKQVETYEL